MRVAQARRSRAQPSSRCSKLSRTSNACNGAIVSASNSGHDRSACSRTPTARPSVGRTSSGSVSDSELDEEDAVHERALEAIARSRAPGASCRCRSARRASRATAAKRCRRCRTASISAFPAHRQCRRSAEPAASRAADGRRVELQGRIASVNAPLELAQLVRRLEPELVDEVLPPFPVDVERLRLPIVSIEREHQQPPRRPRGADARPPHAAARRAPPRRVQARATRRPTARSPAAAARRDGPPRGARPARRRGRRAPVRARARARPRRGPRRARGCRPAKPWQPRASSRSNTSRSSSPGSTTSAYPACVRVKRPGGRRRADLRYVQAGGRSAPTPARPHPRSPRSARRPRRAFRGGAEALRRAPGAGRAVSRTSTPSSTTRNGPSTPNSIPTP